MLVMIASNMLEIITSTASMEVTLDIDHIYIQLCGYESWQAFFYYANGLTTTLQSINHSMLFLASFDYSVDTYKGNVG